MKKLSPETRRKNSIRHSLWQKENPGKAKASVKRYRDKHPDRYKAYVQVSVWRIAAYRMLVKQELGGKCVDCGYDNPLALEFDHISRGAKRALVTNLRSLARIRAEASGCVLRCANCHRIKTWINRDSANTRYLLRALNNKDEV